MTVNGLINKILSYTDNVGASDAHYVARRSRILNLLNEVVNEVWVIRSWPFAMRDATVSIPAGTGQGELPQDFGELSEIGGVYNNSSRYRMRETSPQELLLDAESTNNAWDPRAFSIFGLDPLTFRKLIHTERNGGDVTLHIWYKTQPPRFDTHDDESNALDQFPPPYHDSVLVAGVMARTQKSKGDAREWQTTYQEARAQMIRGERPQKTRVTRMPRALASW